MKYLTLTEVQYVAHRLAKELMIWNEPIPDFNSRYPKVLEACLAAPMHTFNKKELYAGFNKKAAVLFYFMIKDHPFQNGNKRVAMMTMLYFLFKNGRWLEIDSQKLYNFAKWVAASDPEVKDQVIGAIQDILRKYSVQTSKEKNCQNKN